MLGARDGNEAVVSALLVKGAEFDRADNNGSTALSLGAVNGHEAVVAALLAKGAEVDRASKVRTGRMAWFCCGASNHGRTALDYAEENGHASIVAMLTAHSSVSSAAV